MYIGQTNENIYGVANHACLPNRIAPTTDRHELRSLSCKRKPSWSLLQSNNPHGRGRPDNALPAEPHGWANQLEDLDVKINERAVRLDAAHALALELE